MNFSIKEVLYIHEILISEHGGTLGVRDKRALESALGRPFQTFDKRDLYPSIEEKASSIIESILINHPFLDGNKRLGYTLFRMMLLSQGKDIKATENEKYQFVVEISKGNLKYNGILDWVKDKVIE